MILVGLEPRHGLWVLCRNTHMICVYVYLSSLFTREDISSLPVPDLFRCKISGG